MFKQLQCGHWFLRHFFQVFIRKYFCQKLSLRLKTALSSIKTLKRYCKEATLNVYFKGIGGLTPFLKFDLIL